MNADGYRAALDTLGLNQTTGAKFLEIGPRSSRRYAGGELPVPPMIAMLLTLMVQMGLRPQDVERYKEPS